MYCIYVGLSTKATHTSHVLAHPLNISNKQFMVSLEAKEDRSGKLFYDHEMIKIEALSEATPQSGGAIHQQPSGPHKGLLNQYTKLVLSVNPNSASRTINPETGEPLVVYHGTGERLWKFKHGEEGGSFFTTNVCLEEPGILSLDAGLDL